MKKIIFAICWAILSSTSFAQNKPGAAIVRIGDSSQLKALGIQGPQNLKTQEKVDIATIGAIISARDDYYSAFERRLIIYRVATDVDSRFLYFFFSAENAKDFNIVYVYDIKSKILKCSFPTTG